MQCSAREETLQAIHDCRVGFNMSALKMRTGRPHEVLTVNMACGSGSVICHNTDCGNDLALRPSWRFVRISGSSSDHNTLTAVRPTTKLRR